MIVHLSSSAGGYPGSMVLTEFDGTMSTQAIITPMVGHMQNYGWYGIGLHADLEIDGEGRPAVLIGRSNHTVASTITTNYLEYYVRESSVWTGGVIRAIPSTKSLQGLDLIFDEAGRPFIVYSIRDQDLGDTFSDVYLMTAPTPQGSIIAVR